MSEDERTRMGAQDEQSDDVEAHRAASKNQNDEGGTETEGDDDFEAHRATKNQVRPT